MASTMQGLVNFDRRPQSVEIRDKPIPEIGANDVLLQTAAVSICGSDVHQWAGSHGWPVNYPVILGHEFGGTIVKAGRNVDRFKESDRVVSETAAVIDENSPYSRRGLYNLDRSRLGFGYGVDGAMANYVCVPERCLHAIPDNLEFQKAALTEPCCVSYNAVCNYTNIKPGDHVLVIGPGPIGLLCTQLAKLGGAGHLIVAGLPSDEKRFGAARRFGADATLATGVLEYVAELGDGLGVDVVIDAAGVSATLELALDAVRPEGQITKVGWGHEPLDYNLDSLVMKSVTLQGSFSHNWTIWERVIAMLGSGQLHVDPIITRVAKLEEWQPCFENMHDGEYTKAILLPNG